MSMICYVGQVSDQEIEKIKADPKRVELLANEGRYFQVPAKRSFFQKLFGKKEAPEVEPEPSYTVEPACDLDKSWHALHFMLTGDPVGGEFPLNFLMTGGKEIGEDMGYGPIRFLNSAQAKVLKNELDKLTVTDFENKFKPAELTRFEIYPDASGWTDEAKPWLTDNYSTIKDFIDQAVTGKKGIYINIA